MADENKPKRARREYTAEDRERLFAAGLEFMRQGNPAGKSADLIGVPKKTFLDWADLNSDYSARYAVAREIMMDHWAEEIITVSEEEPRYTSGNGSSVTDGAGISRNRLRVDSRKWLLSKLRPERYGDRIVQEHVGAGGGPMQTMALGVDQLKNLSDDELKTMRSLLKKATTGKE